MPVVQKLINEIGFATDKASKKKAEQAIGDVKEAFSRITGAVKGVSKSLLTYTRQQAQTADESIKAARNIGLTVESLTELYHAGGLAGIQNDRVRDGLKDLQKNSYDAAKGSKEMAKNFRKLGINVRKFVKLPADQKLEKVADGLAKIENPTARATLRMRVLGESGLHMGNLLDGGSKSIKEMRQEARDLGFVLDTETAQKAEKMNDAISIMERSAQGLIKPLANELVPVLTEMAEETTKFIRSIDRRTIKDIGRTIADTLLSVFRGLLDTAKLLKENWLIVKTVLIGLVGAYILAGLRKMKDSIGDMLGTLKDMAKSGTVATLKFILLAAAVALAYLAIDDLVAFLEGRPSLLADYLGDEDEIQHWRNAFEMFFEDLESILDGNTDLLVDWLKLAHANAVDEVAPLMQGLADEFLSTWEFAQKNSSISWDEWMDNFRKDGERIKKDFKPITDWIEGVWKTLIQIIEGEWDRFTGSIKDGVNGVIDDIKGIPGKIGDTLSFLPGLGGDEKPVAAVAGAIPGATSPALDRAVFQVRQQPSAAVNLRDVNINIEGGTDLQPSDISDAVTQGLNGGIGPSDLRRAGLATDGAMQ